MDPRGTGNSDTPSETVSAPSVVEDSESTASDGAKGPSQTLKLFHGIVSRFKGLFTTCLASPDANHAVTETAHIVQRAFEMRTAITPEHESVACRKGCSHCCMNLVTVSPVEVLALAEHIKGRDDADALIEKTRQAAAEVPANDVLARKSMRIPCPLLDDQGACSVYDERPLTCRAYASFDVDRCVADLETGSADVPVAMGAQQNRLLIMLALSASMRDADVPFGQYELISGLNIALSTDDAAARWMDGEDVLAGARFRDQEHDEAWLENTLQELDDAMEDEMGTPAA